jgi:hypothetical protein
MEDLRTGNLLVVLFYLFVLSGVLFFIKVLQKNYAFYKRIRLKRILLPIPKNSFYDFSERRIKLAKKYNLTLRIFHLLIVVIILYFYLVRPFYNE